MRKPYLYILIFIVLLQACSRSLVPAPTATMTRSAPVAATKTKISVEPSPSATAEAPTSSPIAHKDVPVKGTVDPVIAHDNDNALTFEKKGVRGGDEFFRNQFERPFTANDMSYLPDLDIVNFSITSDDTFYYVKISLVGLNADTQSLTGSYGVEIDRNRDGRAEILLATHGPYSKDFSADNVSVYLDLNNDVGGSKINRPDDSKGDGFETVVFDLGQNVYPESDPDFAWVRQTSDASLPAIEIAFKKWIFKGAQESFMWSVDASGTSLDPSKFYLNDSMTPEEAGAAVTSDPNYPIKAFAAFDNTCRMPLGFTAVGTETLGCFKKSGDPEKIIRSTDDTNSICGQFSELCTRTEKSRIPFVK